MGVEIGYSGPPTGPLERRLDLAALPVRWLVELLVWSAKDLPGPMRKICQRRERTGVQGHSTSVVVLCVEEGCMSAG